jgi:hypothetical protein
MDLANRRMGHPAENGNVISQGLQGFETFRELKVFPFSVRKPGPVLKSRIVFSRHRHAVGHVEAGKSLPRCHGCFGERLKGGKGESKSANSSEESSAIERGEGCHGRLVLGKEANLVPE